MQKKGKLGTIQKTYVKGQMTSDNRSSLNSDKKKKKKYQEEKSVFLSI